MSNCAQASGRKCGIISAVTLAHSSWVRGFFTVGSTSGMWISLTVGPVFLQLTSSPPSQSEMCDSFTNAFNRTTLPSPLLAAASDGEALTEVTPQFPHAANGSVGGATLA